MTDFSERKKKPGTKLESQRQLSLWNDFFMPKAEKGRRVAAGYRNGSSLNNAGENGNYWSSSLNTSNSNNANNLNFNSGNHNVNNNNRNNGQSVRSVTALTHQQLLADLYRAYGDARKHKRGRTYQLDFEVNLEENLRRLCDELMSRTYRPEASTAFVIHDPVMREVFAAQFRDRVVHHLYYNYMHCFFERTFIADTYSCINGRGTHFGCNRLEHHIRAVSRNYTRPCFVLQMDVSGYFMSINRLRLLDICKETFRRKKHDKASFNGRRWDETIDFDFIAYLTEVIIMTDPTEDCRIKGRMADWDGLPESKSLFRSQPGCGLPIGNLTSQLFSNVYMNRFDQFMKRTLKCHHYGRYVDDSYVVSDSREWLLDLIPTVRDFLQWELGLELHPDKIRIVDIRFGVQFLGQYLMPFRRHVAKKSMMRIENGMERLSRMPSNDERSSQAVVNSYWGVMRHVRSYRRRVSLVKRHPWLFRLGCFNASFERLSLFPFSKCDL